MIFKFTPYDLSFRWILMIIALHCFCTFDLLSYEVKFEGIKDPELFKLIQSASQLEKLKEIPPETSLGLKSRAERDMDNMLQALHSQAYYHAKVNFSLDKDSSLVTIKIEPGPIYPIAAFNIRYLQNDEEVSESVLSCPIRLDNLQISIGDPAMPANILNAEDRLLDELNLQGYAFASIKKRDVFADQKAKNVIVWLVVEMGPISYFGPLTINGNERVNENFFYKKLRWTQGELYNPQFIEKTQEALELSGLFRSVNITYAKEPIESHLLPVEISVLEAKQRSIGYGLNYITSLGPGITGEWEDRNILGEGQKLSIGTNLWVKLQEGNITYLIPEFQRQDQNLIWSLKYKRERIKPYHDNEYSFSGILERKFTDHLRFSYGAMYVQLRSEDSDLDGTFNLFKVPLQLRWSNTDSILEPTSGFNLQFKSVPSFQIFKPRFGYVINYFTGSFYKALTENKRHIFAAKFTFGTILGASRHEIPPPERFFAGSESTIRGYRYLTISPLDRHDHPIGGRSIWIYSLELRNRIGKSFGWVLFYDVGNVYKNDFPNFREGVRQSVGLGIRYYTPIGPLRLDIAFPLNKRHLDHSLEAYFSIGQAF